MALLRDEDLGYLKEQFAGLAHDVHIQVFVTPS